MEVFDIKTKKCSMLNFLQEKEVPNSLVHSLSFFYNETYYLYGFNEASGANLWKFDLSSETPFKWISLKMKGPAEDGVMVTQTNQKHIFYFYGGYFNIFYFLFFFSFLFLFFSNKGYCGEGNLFKRDLWKFDCLTEKFEQIPIESNLDCAFGSLNYFNDKLYILGGKKKN